ncbi:hypothetical protein GCM10010495_48660 [Kitasatospora herbaricolor]|nr:hypothetical protein GCM10010495_48660 [Kitasatospora herbaricolor]
MNAGTPLRMAQSAPRPGPDPAGMADTGTSTAVNDLSIHALMALWNAAHHLATRQPRTVTKPVSRLS